MKGKFLVIEGLDGSGKTTVSSLLAEVLNDSLGGDSVYLTAEPFQAAAAGSFIRDMLQKRIPHDSWGLALAFAANRQDHCNRFIAPALAAGKLVICDRYKMSSLVYQSDECGMATINLLNQKCLHPDLTIFLDIPKSVQQARLRERGVREIFEGEDQFDTHLQRYTDAADLLRFYGQKILSVDASGSVPQVTAEVVQMVHDHLA